MKHRFLIACLSLTLGTAGVFLSSGCGSSTPNTTTDAATTNTGTDAAKADATATSTGTAGPVGVVPPARPSASAASTAEKWFEVSAINIGKGDAWKTLGFDIDRTTTTADNVNTTCRKPASASQETRIDGEGGRDNNFGQHILTTLATFAPTTDPQVSITKAIADGSLKIWLRLTNFGAADNASVPGALYFGTKDGINPSSLTSATAVGDLNNAVVKFANGYMAGGVWVSGDASAPFNLSLNVAGFSLSIPIAGGVVSVNTNDGKAGVIAGAINGQQLKTQLLPIAKNLGICNENDPTFQTIADIVLSVSDVITDKLTQQDPNVECNGISIGLGFEATAMTAGESKVGPVTPPAPDPCSDAGTTKPDSGSTDSGTASDASTNG